MRPRWSSFEGPGALVSLSLRNPSASSESKPGRKAVIPGLGSGLISASLLRTLGVGFVAPAATAAAAVGGFFRFFAPRLSKPCLSVSL